jgi:hypothetical protein
MTEAKFDAAGKVFLHRLQPSKERTAGETEEDD